MTKIVHHDLIGITVSNLIANFGNGLVAIFIPLLLLQKGLLLWQICAFYVAYAICKLIVNYPTTKIINHFGARTGLIAGTSAAIIFMIALTAYLAFGSLFAMAVMAVAMAVRNSFLWNSEHLFISRAMDTTRKSRDMANIDALKRIVNIIAPFIGGFVAALLGQIWLTAVATAILIASIVPIWQIDELAGGHKKINNLRYNLRSAPKSDIIANFGFNAHSLVGLLLWPMYLAVFVPDFRSIGIITAAASFIAAIATQIAGMRGDRGKTQRVLKEGTALSSMAHLARLLAASNPAMIVSVSAFYEIAASYQFNPWVSLYYSHARHRGIGYILSLEIAGDIAYIVSWTIFGIIAATIGNSQLFTFAFIAAAVVVWLCLCMRPEARQPA